MSNFNKLFKKLTPDDVNFVPLWEVTSWDKRFASVNRNKQPKITRYKYVTAADLKKLTICGGDVYLLSTGKTSYGFTTEELAGNNLNNGEVVSIPGGGTASVQYCNGKFVTSDNRLATSNDTKILNTKYLYYFMFEKTEEIQSYYRGPGIKHPYMSKVLDMIIPLPPIEVQNEIVKILDNFKEFTSGFTLEFTKRQKQYKYYLNKLLTFKELKNNVCYNFVEYIK